MALTTPAVSRGLVLNAYLRALDQRVPVARAKNWIHLKKRTRRAVWERSRAICRKATRFGTLGCVRGCADDLGYLRSSPIGCDVDEQLEGEYQGPGYDQPCPRLQPNGRSTCEHSAGFHREDGVCVKCLAGAAKFRPCARPATGRASD